MFVCLFVCLFVLKLSGNFNCITHSWYNYFASPKSENKKSLELHNSFKSYMQDFLLEEENVQRVHVYVSAPAGIFNEILL